MEDKGAETAGVFEKMPPQITLDGRPGFIRVSSDDARKVRNALRNGERAIDVRSLDAVSAEYPAPLVTISVDHISCIEIDPREAVD